MPAKQRTVCLLLLSAIAVAACGDETDRPRGELLSGVASAHELVGADETSDAEPAEAEGGTTDAASTVQSPAPGAACPAGSTEECTLTWYTDDGSLKHCRKTIRTCWPDGSRWSGCGEPVAGVTY